MDGISFTDLVWSLSFTGPPPEGRVAKEPCDPHSLVGDPAYHWEGTASTCRSVAEDHHGKISNQCHTVIWPNQPLFLFPAHFLSENSLAL